MPLGVEVRPPEDGREKVESGWAVAGGRSRVPEVPETSRRAPWARRRLPEREMVPPGRTEPMRRSKGSGRRSVVPAVERCERGPRTRVVRAVSLLGRAALESPAEIEMVPAGAKTEPMMAAVRPENWTDASGSEWMEEPASMMRSPRRSGTSRMPSRMPAAEKLRLTGERRPTGRRTGRRAKAPLAACGEATRLEATGAMRVLGAMTRAGSVRPSEFLTGRPVRLNEEKPPEEKKEGWRWRAPGVEEELPMRMSGAVMASEPPRAPEKPESEAEEEKSPPMIPLSCGSSPPLSVMLPPSP